MRLLVFVCVFASNVGVVKVCYNGVSKIEVSKIIVFLRAKRA